MYVFPIKPNRIENIETKMLTEVITAKSGNEQRIGHILQPKQKYKLALEALPMVGTIDMAFQTQYRQGFPNFSYPAFEWFFVKIARGRMNSFLLKAYPPIFTNDIIVRFSDDKYARNMINKNFCNITVEVETC